MWAFLALKLHLKTGYKDLLMVVTVTDWLSCDQCVKADALVGRCHVTEEDSTVTLNYFSISIQSWIIISSGTHFFGTRWNYFQLCLWPSIPEFFLCRQPHVVSKYLLCHCLTFVRRLKLPRCQLNARETGNLDTAATCCFWRFSDLSHSKSNYLF